MEKKISIKTIAVLQAAVCLYTLSGIAGKLASRYDFLSFKYILCYGMEIVILGIYAVIWQQIIKKADLSVAYTNKAMSIFWSMIWAFLIFKEKIVLKNIIGVVVIFIGILVVNRND